MCRSIFSSVAVLTIKVIMIVPSLILSTLERVCYMSSLTLNHMFHIHSVYVDDLVEMAVGAHGVFQGMG